MSTSLLERAGCAAATVTDRAMVIGCGDDAQHDDAVGPVVVRELCHRLPWLTPLPATPDLETALRERWRRADLVIVVAAARSDPAKPGRTHLLVTDLPRPNGVQPGMQVIRELSRTPRRVVVYAVEGADFTPGTGLTQGVEAAVRPLVDQVVHQINGMVEPEAGRRAS